MLVEFRVGNYRSFREEQTLSLVASTDTNLTSNCVDKGKLTLLKAVGIYGPNASGKSNLIKALSTMQQIIEEPAKPGEKLPITPFKLDDEYEKEPSSFEVTFYHKEIRYRYGFTATNERIYDEWLYAYPEGRLRDSEQAWFERKLDKKTGKTDWSFGSYLKGEKEKLKDRVINNVLFLSVGAQWNNEQLTIVYKWFSEKILIILPLKRSPVQTANMLLDAKQNEDHRKLFYAYINDMMQRADFGIHGVDVKKEEIDLKRVKFPQDMPEEIRKKILGQFEIKIRFIHRAGPDGKDVHFSHLEESDGTKRFFELAGPWFLAVMEGRTLLVDELEASLHPLLVRELIKFIQNPNTSKTGAQLIFATHNTTLLDHELFRRDQIWFTEKDEHISTHLYSMLDYKPRKGEAMQKGYLSGRYGAIPIIEAFKLNG